MQFSCSQCSARYSVPDERVRGKRVRTKCRKCGAEILLEGPRENDADGADEKERPTVPPPSSASPLSALSPTFESLPPPAPPPEPVLPEVAPKPATPTAGFSFDDEATAVIEPDRARALLEAETAKDVSPPPAPLTETPLGFGFDDESTQVVAPEVAEQLLTTQHAEQEPPAAPRASEPPKTAEPSIVLDDALGAAKPKPKTFPAPAAQAAQQKLPFPEDLAAFQNEPTRVLRIKKSGNGTFWLVFVLALAAAVAGGFVAAQMMGHGPAPQHGSP